jgi:Methyltransferase domain
MTPGANRDGSEIALEKPVPLPTLDELALNHGTDKSSAGHDFARIYEQFLEAWRHLRITLLEIGVLDGASLRMWRDFFPEARLFGLDNDAAVGERVHSASIFIGDQADATVLDAVVRESGPLDLIIDDGAHKAKQQIGSLLYLWPHLTPGGIYIVEDVHTSYLPQWGMTWRQPGTTMELLKGIADDLHTRWHDGPLMLLNVESLHFYRETCILVKQTNGGSRPQ